MAEQGKRLSAGEVAAMIQRDNPKRRVATYENGNAVAIWHSGENRWVAFAAKLLNGEWAKDPAVLVNGKPVYDDAKWTQYGGGKGGA